MIHFVHSYIPGDKFWDGLVKRGFIDDNSGVKIIQCVGKMPEECFNLAAAKGTQLYDVVMEAKRVFWVDRIQGGTFIYDYDFDKTLIEHYANALGDHYLGFQMHEYMSNYMSDFHKILGDYRCYISLEESIALAKSIVLSEKLIIDNVNRTFPQNNDWLYLESQTVSQWLSAPLPIDTATFISNVTAILDRQSARVLGRLVFADSQYLGTRLQCERGARNIMPEIGAQTPFSRVQIAMARGNARSRGLMFGVYQEPWGSMPVRCAYYMRDPSGKIVTEWGAETDDNAFLLNSDNGGSSLSLMRRVFFYAMLAGASYIAEEWGAYNTFRDLYDFEISPYGKIKKDFIDFARNHPEIGNMYNPIAIVLPVSLKILNIGCIRADDNHTGIYAQFPLMEDRRLETHIGKALYRIYASMLKHYTDYREYASITNSEFGDLFDIVYEDDRELARRYDVFINLTGHRLDFENVIESNDLCDMAEGIRSAIRALSPIEVDGGSLWLLNQTEDGWIAAFMNNEGVTRTAQDGDGAIPEATEAVVAKFKRAQNNLRILYGNADVRMIGNEIRFDLTPGEIMIVAFDR